MFGSSYDVFPGAEEILVSEETWLVKSWATLLTVFFPLLMMKATITHRLLER